MPHDRLLQDFNEYFCGEGTVHRELFKPILVEISENLPDYHPLTEEQFRDTAYDLIFSKMWKPQNPDRIGLKLLNGWHARKHLFFV